MTKTSEAPAVVWAHGFGASPETDSLGRRVQRELGQQGLTVHRPALSVVEGEVVVPHSLYVQASTITQEVKRARQGGRFVIVAAHSQGCLSAALAVAEVEDPLAVVLLAPPLSGFERRLGSFMEKGGIVQRDGLPPVRMTDEYWASFLVAKPVDLIADGLSLSGRAYCITAGGDGYLGPQADEYADLRSAAPSATFGTIKEADHFFRPPHHLAVAGVILEAAANRD